MNRSFNRNISVAYTFLFCYSPCHFYISNLPFLLALMLCSFIGSAWVVVTCVVHPSHFYVRYLGKNLSLSKKISCFCSKESSLFTSEDKVETGACLFVCFLPFLTLVSYYGIYLFICAAASNLPTVLFGNTSHTSHPCRDVLSMFFFVV